jgi:hypothetical protein
MPPKSPVRVSFIYEILPHPFSFLDCSLLDEDIVGQLANECKDKIEACVWQHVNAQGRKSVNVEFY